MPQSSLGKIRVAVPGSPVRATNNLPVPDEPFYVHAYAVQRKESSVGTMYVSLSPTDDRVVLSKILGLLTKSVPAFAAGITNEMNAIDMSRVYIDADNAGDEVVIPILVC